MINNELKMRHVLVDAPINRGISFKTQGGLKSIKVETETFLSGDNKIVTRSALTLISGVDALKVSIPVYKGLWKPLIIETWTQDNRPLSEDKGLVFKAQLGFEIKVVFM